MLDKVSTCGNLLHIVSHWEDLGGGWYCVIENTQSPKICLNFNWGGGYSVTENSSKSQDLPKFQFSGWVGGGVFCN